MGESIRFFENFVITDETINETSYSPSFGLGRFENINLFVDAIVSQEAKAVEFAEVQEGYDGQEATFLLELGSADGGTFDIGLAEDMQEGLAYDISDSNLQTELRKIDGWDDVTVSESAGIYTITIPLELEQPELVAVFVDLTEGGGDLTTPATLVVDNEYEAPINTIHTFEVKNASGGNFTITYDGDTTSALVHNISAANLKIAIVGLKVAYTDDNVEVVKGNGVYTVTFEAMYIDADDVSTNAEGLTQTAVKLQVEAETLQPYSDNWFNLKDGEGDHYITEITETEKQSVVIPYYGDNFRLKYTVSGSGPSINLKVSAVVK